MSRSLRTGLSLLLVVSALPGAGCQQEPVDPAAERAALAWEQMVAREEALRALGPALRDLGRSVMNLRLPDPSARARFGVVAVTDDLAVPTAAGAPSGIARTRALTVQPMGEPAAPSGISLWDDLFARFAFFEHASFQAEAGDFEDAERTRLTAAVRFRAAGRLEGGSRAALRGQLELGFERVGDHPPDDPEAWRIASWRTLGFEFQESAGAMFREVLDAALPDPEALRRARESKHARLAAARLADPDGFEPPHAHFFVGSQDRHPGVSVVDVNADGLDDVYVMARFGPNQLFVNRGDGTFTEQAAAYGLDVEDHTAAALFADFDNDGDPDVFLGRTLAPSLYLENREGRFVDTSSAVLGGAALPALVSSLAAADVDGDGLLDLYVSTYAAQMLVAEAVAKDRSRRELGTAPATSLLEAFLPRPDAERLMAATREAGAHEYMSLPGPPNLLLRNAGGGRFETSPAGVERAFRNTFQATFADVDADGDPDLYLAHDFSPNQMLRNEGAGRFADVTEPTGTADVGFGMGAAFGDYDRDGREDLYVSNMFSKAGKRITASFDGADPRLAKMARGNTLFRNAGELAGERFEVVSGTEPPALAVEEAAWAWGGQFLDADNDGFLDVFALSGYYTAPTDVESFVDI